MNSHLRIKVSDIKVYRRFGDFLLSLSSSKYIIELINIPGPCITGKHSRQRKLFCGIGRIKYGGLGNVRPPIIDPLACSYTFTIRKFLESKHILESLNCNKTLHS